MTRPAPNDRGADAARQSPADSAAGTALGNDTQAKACTCGRPSLHRATCAAFERFEPMRSDFVGVAGARLVFVGIADRAKFDSIDLPCLNSGENEDGHVLSKRLGGGLAGVTVIFQHWIKGKTVMAMIAESDAARASKESAS